MAKKFTETYTIPYYDCDSLGKLQVPTLLKMMIKTSGAQSDALGVDVEFVASFGLTWIITQHDLNITRMPRANETIKITTQAGTYNRFFCYRQFWAHDEEGNECASMKSTFGLMNEVERKLSSVEEQVIKPYESEKVKRIERSDKIPAMTEKAKRRHFPVSFYEIDGNHHVNNSVYPKWMIDCFDYDFLSTHEVKRLLIKYNKEIRYDQTIESAWETFEEDELKTVHHILDSDGSCAEAFIEWQKRA